MTDLDNNATTRPHPSVIAAMTACMEQHWHNPSSAHRAGQEAKRGVELARASAAALIGAPAKAIVFTSGGTEAIDLAIRGALGAATATLHNSGADEPEASWHAARPMNIVTTPIEHSAVHDLVRELANPRSSASPVNLRVCPVRRDGTVDAAAIMALVDDDTVLVSVQWCNNEVGAIQPVGQIARACRQRGVPFHCDGTQWVGKMPTRVLPSGGDESSRFLANLDPKAKGSPATSPSAPSALGPLDPFCEADFLSFSPHKFHGPKGVGVLYCRPGSRLMPQLWGTQELGRRGGTENVPGIIGCGVACELAAQWLASDEERVRLAAVRDRFEKAVIDGVAASGCLKQTPEVNGPRDQQRLWNTTNIGFPTLEAEALLLALSEKGIWASAGAACSSGSLDPSPVLLAMGVPEALAHGSIRFSLSRQSDEAEVMATVAQIVACVRRVAGA